MPSAATLRLEIERALEDRIPAALTPKPQTVYETASTGIAAVDALVGGGFPVGAITELAGPVSSGRTSLALSFMAGRTCVGQVCAWVDASDALDPESAAASGVSLRQLLWVRCLDRAGAAKGKPWSRLDQALRAADLILEAAGFAAVVLDLGGIDARDAARIPLATWFRFRQNAQRSRTSLVVVGERACAQSAAAVVLECGAGRASVAGGTVLSSFGFSVSRERQRFGSVGGGRKPPASVWLAASVWDLKRRA
jgi:hypothetical protein